MTKSPPARKDHNARTHGLTSRNFSVALQGEAEQLSETFLAGSLQTPELRTAARSVADVVLLLKNIQSAIIAETDRLTEGSTVAAQFDQWVQALRTSEGLVRGLSHNQGSSTPGFEAFLPTPDELAVWTNRLAAEKATPDIERRIARQSIPVLHPGRTLGSLKTYDRKARSRLSKAIQCLDYLKIEASRKQN